MFPQSEVQAPSQPSCAPPTPVVENLMYKNDLNCYCQRLGIPLPVYQTAVEGCAQSIRFRSTVLVDIRRFTSSNTFPNRKSAEQDAAMLALQHLLSENETRSTNLRLYLRNLVCEDKTRCKMIMHEFASKIKTVYEYKTVQAETRPVFVSSLTLSGTCYKGEAGKNKKEAEQLAALASILSLLDDLTYATTVSEVIKSKFKICAAFYEVKNFQNTSNCSVTKDEHKPTSLTHDVQMRISQQTYSRSLADENIQRSIKLLGSTEEQGGSRRLTDLHCGYGKVEKQQEKVNLQGEIANHSNFGVLDDKQDNAALPIEAVTISRSSYVPLPPCSESQHEYKLSEVATVPSVSQQNSIPNV